MKLTIFLLFICFINEVRNQSVIQEYVKSLDRRAFVHLEKYINDLNKGPYKSCCGVLNKTSCLECQYLAKIHLVYRREYFKDKTKVYELGSFSQKSRELSEHLSTEIFIGKSSWTYIYVSLYNVDKMTNEIDRTHYLDIWNSYTYIFEGYGFYNRMQLWGSIQLTPLGRHDKLAYFNLLINSIYFDNYKDLKGDCCSGFNDQVCNFPCSYTIRVQKYYYVSSTTKEVNAYPYGRYQKLNMQLGIENLHSNELISYVYIIIESLHNKNIIDKFLIDSNFHGEPGKTYSKTNIVGSYGNVHLNISYSFICERYAKKYCSTTCFVLTGAEYCNTLTGQQRCKNGAIDDNLCETITETCDRATCNNAGRCQLENNKKRCYCDPGYHGNYCQKWRCENECNGNGLCVSPNKCKCYENIRGENCTEFQCDNYIENPCGKYSECYVEKNTVKCYCTKNFITGIYCDEPICDPKCVNGKCHYYEEKNLSKCVCFDRYRGKICDELMNFKYIEKKSSIFYGILGTIIIVILIAIASFVLIYIKPTLIKFSNRTREYMQEDVIY